jgi:integrase
MAKIQVRKGTKGTTYRVEIMRGGSRASRTFKTKKEAEKFSALTTVDDSFASSITNATLNTLKFCDAVTLFLEQSKGKDPSKHQRLEHWSLTFKDRPVGKITKQHVRSELKNLSVSLKPATLNRYKAALGSLYRFLGDEFDIEHNPTKGIQQYAENNARTRFLSNIELVRVLDAAKSSKWNRLFLLVIMAITTGARRTELTSLRWEQINLKAKTARIDRTKNNQPKILTLTNDVILELMKFRYSTGFVFPHSNNLDSYFKNFDCHWKEALSLAGISNFRFHDLRHTCASMLAMSGASLLEIAEVLGHKSISMTQRYSHLCVEHKATLTDRVFGGIVNGE